LRIARLGREVLVRLRERLVALALLEQLVHVRVVVGERGERNDEDRSQRTRACDAAEMRAVASGHEVCDEGLTALRQGYILRRIVAAGPRVRAPSCIDPTPMSLRIYNTLTRAPEGFSPIEPGHVRMYVCGVT